MRKGTFISLSLLLSITGWAQVSSQSGEDVNSSASATSFTNRTGTVYTTSQLASQLQRLRNDIEQILPMLTAYTESVSNVAGRGGKSISGTVTEILTGVLNRHNSASNSGSGSYF